ncbi:MAG TPA: thiamine phosphate synthase [Acidobacteriaceae bacterium]|nr:thiamine phosphate synthase [Acidobacteriaceae bacterium]
MKSTVNLLQYAYENADNGLRMMLYAITNRRLFGNSEPERCAALLEQTAIWAANGLDFIQLREEDMPAREQVDLACAMLGILRQIHSRTRLLINGRPDVAIASGADGVHLPSAADELPPGDVRKIFGFVGKQPYISLSCHTLQQVETARNYGADGILFAPVFGKVIQHEEGRSEELAGSGLAMLRQACQLADPVPVFALGGVTAQNATQCLQMGAAGVAAIRMMHQPPAHWLPLVRS